MGPGDSGEVHRDQGCALFHAEITGDSWVLNMKTLLLDVSSVHRRWGWESGSSKLGYVPSFSSAMLAPGLSGPSVVPKRDLLMENPDRILHDSQYSGASQGPTLEERSLKWQFSGQ